MIYQKHCPGCFENKSNLPVCPLCGYDESISRSAVFLPHGVILGGQYRVGRVLGQPGGFGITYIGWDVYLQQRVAIKEYLPRTVAERAHASPEVVPQGEDNKRHFEFGKEQFLREARIVAKFDHPNIVRVRNFFNANGTAYIVMDYYEGMSLGDYLGNVRGRIDAEVSVGLMQPVLDGLEFVHQRGVVHRDMKPHNIYLAAVGRPIVLDFGAARQAVGDRTPTMSLMLTEGYAPIEQYQRDAGQGAYTDVYGVAATLYRMILGIAPPMALDRVGRDSLEPSGWAGIPILLRPAMRKALAVRPEDRYQSAAEFSAALDVYLEQAAKVPPEANLTLSGEDAPQPPPPGYERVAQPPPPPATSVPPPPPSPILRGAGTSLGNGAAGSAANDDNSVFVPRPPPRKKKKGNPRLRFLVVTLVLSLIGLGWKIQQEPNGDWIHTAVVWLTVPHPELVELAGGNVPLGDASGSRNAVQLPVSPFRIARDEVTRAQFRSFVEHTGYRNPNWATHPCEWPNGSSPLWDEPAWQPKDDEPVTCVTAADALAYTEWLSRETGINYRLPTEAEWEYAARAGSAGSNWWGEFYHPGVAVCADCDAQQRPRQALPATGRLKNLFGLRDVSGNVAELTCSAYVPAISAAAQTCAVTPAANLVLRGGSWIDPLAHLEVTRRASFPAVRRTAWVGFRVAADKRETNGLPASFAR